MWHLIWLDAAEAWLSSSVTLLFINFQGDPSAPPGPPRKSLVVFFRNTPKRFLVADIRTDSRETTSNTFINNTGWERIKWYPETKGFPSSTREKYVHVCKSSVLFKTGSFFVPVLTLSGLRPLTIWRGDKVSYPGAPRRVWWRGCWNMFLT